MTETNESKKLATILRVLPDKPPVRERRPCKADLLKVELNLAHLSNAVCNQPMHLLNDEEKVFKRAYARMIKRDAGPGQHETLETMVTNNTLPLPKHNCKYCMCGNDDTMICTLLRQTLGVFCTPIVKVDEFLQYRQRAIDNNKELYKALINEQ